MDLTGAGYPNHCQYYFCDKTVDCLYLYSSSLNPTPIIHSDGADTFKLSWTPRGEHICQKDGDKASTEGEQQASSWDLIDKRMIKASATGHPDFNKYVRVHNDSFGRRGKYTENVFGDENHETTICSIVIVFMDGLSIVDQYRNSGMYFLYPL